MLIVANILGWLYAHWKWAVGIIAGFILLKRRRSLSSREGLAGLSSLVSLSVEGVYVDKKLTW